MERESKLSDGQLFKPTKLSKDKGTSWVRWPGSPSSPEAGNVFIPGGCL